MLFLISGSNIGGIIGRLSSVVTDNSNSFKDIAAGKFQWMIRL